MYSYYTDMIQSHPHQSTHVNLRACDEKSILYALLSEWCLIHGHKLWKKGTIPVLTYLTHPTPKIAFCDCYRKNVLFFKFTLHILKNKHVGLQYMFQLLAKIDA